jgi:glutaredoxin
MRTYFIVAASLAAAITCGAAAAQTYRWVDDQGRVHYTQTPPPPGARDVQRKNLRQSGAAAGADLPYATRVAAQNFPVKLYARDKCQPCDYARAALVKRAVPFSEINVASQKDLDEVQSISGNAQLPLVMVGSLHQTGFQEQQLNSLLDTAGYPPSGPSLPVEALRRPSPAPPAPSQPAPEAAAPAAASN